MFKKDQIVEVYEDPLTMVRKEGDAKIIEHVQEIEPGVDLYRVNFVGDHPQSIVERKIAESPICCCIDPVHPDNQVCRVHWIGGE